MTAQPTTKSGGGRGVAVVGCGNIGSFLVPLLARAPQISALVLIDHDTYEAKNLPSQSIERRDVGIPKAKAQARRVRRMRPDLRAREAVERVEHVPMGLLRCDLIAACLDSRAARKATSEIAWRLGVPLVDAGVAPGQSLARVTTYLPSADSPCVECSWSSSDYESLDQVYACNPDEGVPATDGTASLGSLAASLQATECDRILSGDVSRAGGQIVMNADDGRTHRTTFRRNADCRFDHRTWPIRRLRAGPRDLTLESLRDMMHEETAECDGLLASVSGGKVVTMMSCQGCGRQRRVLRLEHRLLPVHRRCNTCPGTMVPVGYYTLDRLPLGSLGRSALRKPLSSLGIRPRDVLTLRGRDVEVHYEVGDE